jgi:hypothetical protein
VLPGVVHVPAAIAAGVSVRSVPPDPFPVNMKSRVTVSHSPFHMHMTKLVTGFLSVQVFATVPATGVSRFRGGPAITGTAGGGTCGGARTVLWAHAATQKASSNVSFFIIPVYSEICRSSPYLFPGTHPVLALAGKHTSSGQGTDRISVVAFRLPGRLLSATAHGKRMACDGIPACVALSACERELS